MAAEATWSAHRTAWLVTANAFLATALAIMSATKAQDLESGARLMRSLLPAAAVIVNVATVLMLAAAERVTIELRRAYGRTAEGVPHLLGTPGAHFVGAFVPIVFGLLMAVGWFFIWLA